MSTETGVPADAEGSAGSAPARPAGPAGVAEPDRPPARSGPTDAQVVARSVGAPADFAALFDRHAPAIHRYLARRAGPQVADDLVASTFLVAFERRASYDGARADARPWLYGIASNLLGRFHRDEERRLRAYARAGVDGLAEDGIERALERADAQASKRAVAAAVAELSPEDRDVLLLFAWAALSYAEIAEAVGIPLGTVRSRLNRARRRLRAALGADGPATAPRLIKESHHG
ncbi:sigma-70 family RNA polymerase sigma factor [Frankia sp. CNm7]|uniref:Sigma-70 family RNA polymerase sigma factor n=1 Tax=Frankia nepalensis TaxID=1836974 RepID=A0A937RGM2_9ACTN|nr:sigma-70 family RNA polymerase sigma factor [Frankia nepalensis]MBL7501311.1 sigma-70 family RNA polymerase sigma factor [Frankia nepalensis]MBL7510839.1 sigma-70 family RNA polymerase sigma factor [Frankia nepalensis]MBL7521583.1 sigma-70 family RNA polymerase sigma factor [Frankia nepalensis]MBL7628615.1 sigma-70 family RNA polymerase sigma factor [Frankia nepalensis]